MKRSLFLAFAMLAVVASCDNSTLDSDPDIVGQQLQTEPIHEFNASVSSFSDDTATKTSYSGSGVVSWKVGDKIGIWPEESELPYGNPSQVIFDVINIEGENALLRGNGWGLLPNKTYHAYYPYSSESDQHSVTVSYTGQHPLANGDLSHIPGYDFLHCTWMTSENDKYAPAFSHIGCFVQYVFTLPASHNQEPVNSMVLSADSNIFITKASFDPTNKAPVLSDKLASQVLSFTLGDSSGIKCNSSNQIVVNAMMAPTAWKDRKVTVTLISSSGNEFHSSFTPLADMAAGKYYNISAAATYDDPVIDLSAGERANCYIVPEGGTYKFLAVRGNSSTAVSVKGVKVLWESVGTSKAPAKNSIISKCSFSGGYIYFSTPDTFAKGNAVIAAYSDAACTEGKVLWSWHLWCTPMPDDEEYKNGAGYLLDRNLGALSRTGDLSAGLFYQWGRKDPFMGTASLSSAIPMASNGQFNNVARTKTNGTVAWTQAHPTTFIYCSSLPLDWLYTADATLWYSNGTKTMYDPCPPGYRVIDGSTTANTKAGRGFWAKALGTNWRITSTTNTFTSSYGSLVFNNYALSFPTVSGNAYYPATGCLTDSSGKLMYVGTNMMVWTNYPAGSDTGKAWNTQFSGVMDLNMQNDPHSLYLNWNSGRAAGKNVRCMLMKSKSDMSTNENEGFGDSPINSAW